MFDNIIGNDNIKTNLTNAVKNDKVSHSYLFVGTEGIGKKMIAEEFAKMILCLDMNDNYCNRCKSCIEFDTKNNPDFSIIELEGNSIKIEQIREMQKRVNEKPIISSKKIYIINDSDKMTREAQNCLLKTLEEPPEYIVIILIAANESSLLTTIKSRCTIIHFNAISNNQLQEYLKDNCNINTKSKFMIQSCQGSIGKALVLKDKIEFYEKLEKIFLDIENKNIVDIINMSEDIYKAKDDKNDILDYINVILINLAKDDVRYAKCINIIEDTKRRIKGNANYDMSIDNMLFNICETINEVD